MFGNLNVTAETMAMAKTALGAPMQMGQDLNKGVSISTGLTWYDLMAPAKNLYPVITPLRNSLPRKARANPGDAAHWKSIFSIVGSGFDASGWVPEGQRSGTMSYQAVDVSATYVTIGEEDFLTFEAESAAKGLEDENAMVTMRLLQKMMLKEEAALLGGNKTVALGTPTAPTTSTATTGGTIAAATYNVAVVALTQEGYQNSKAVVGAGVATSRTITGADGNTFTLNGGSSNKSNTTAQATTGSTSTLNASTPAINGAVAYAWFVGTAGNERLQTITTINSVTLTAVRTDLQLLSAITADCSRNQNLAFDGLLSTTFAAAAAGNAIVTVLPTGTPGVGTKLTPSGRGSIVEIDTMLRRMWDEYRMTPTVIWVNAQELQNITNGILNASSGPLLRQNVEGNEYRLTASGTIDAYFNPFSVNGGNKIPVRVHPNVAPGTILMYAERLPEWYQSNATPAVAEVLTRRDYYRIDWPLRTRKREYGVYAEEVLAVYAPFALGVITNIAN